MSAQKRPSLSQRSELIYDVHQFGVNVDTREIFLHGYMDASIPNDDDEPGIDYRVANIFLKNLTVLDYLSDKPILIHMMTCGGSWNFGIAIYNAIKFSKNDIIVLAHGHARSMSSIIPQAADYRVIMPDADFLIHFGTESFNGNYTSVQAEAQWDKLVAERMLDIYIERCKDGDFWRRNNIRDEKSIKEWLRREMTIRQEFYMTARESVDMGFFDAVLGDEDCESLEVLYNYYGDK